MFFSQENRQQMGHEFRELIAFCTYGEDENCLHHK